MKVKDDDRSIFHVHTYRCLHAGSEKEIDYVQTAIELGAKQIVFTDHAPFPKNPFNHRMEMSELADYVKILSDLKKQYMEQIDIKIGLEIEFVSKYIEYYRALKEKWNIDILLLGQHFSLLSDGRYTFELQDKSQEAFYLADDIIKAMETGFFNVLAHPDQIFRRMKKWDFDTEKISKEIKDCAIQTGIILEQNISNMFEKKRKNLYRTEFWTGLSDELKTIYGVDAHSTEEMKINYHRQLELYKENKK